MANRSTIVVVLLVLILPTGAAAQYFGPPPQTASEIASSPVTQLDSKWARGILDEAGIEVSTLSDEQVFRVLGDYLSPSYAARNELAENALPRDSKAIDRVRSLVAADLHTAEPPPARKTVRWPISEGRQGLLDLSGDSAAAGGLRAITRFGANVSNDQIFVTGDVVTGAIGPIPFGVTTAAVVTDTDTLQDLSSNLTRLVYNGGTLGLRVTLPVLHVNTSEFGMLNSVNLMGGLLGDLSNTDSLSFSVAPTLDTSLRFTLKSLVDTKDPIIGAVRIPLRVGWAWSEKDFGLSTDDLKSFFFLQGGLGITDRSGKVLIAILVTWPLNDAIREQVPRLAVNLSAAR